LQRIIGEDVRIETRLDPEAWPVGGDPELLTQMLVNLVVNARDAMPEGGTVIIATANRVVDASFCAQHLEARPGQYCRLSVADTGAGMDEVTLSRIFEPFFTTKEAGQGSGLGLSVVYGLVRDLGGWIEVASRPRQGTTFYIYLPRYLAGEEGCALEPRSDGISTLPAGRNEQILVVEDDPDIRRIVVAYLEGHGYRPLAAATAEEAMVLVEEHEGALDLVFADVVLPGRSGLELARQVREICPQCRILLTSGYTDLKSRIEEIKELGLPYIDKPYRLPTLLARIHDLLR
ncbi:MAG TPA: response regulator, partial [Desulfobacterales bacterium]|nr:response regulator [Desulfobacterales bacterium]